MGYVSSGKEFTFYDMPVDQIVRVNDQTLSINNNYAPTVRTILNCQWWNAGFSIITEANTNGGMRVSASASKNVRSIDAPDGVEFALCLDFNYDKLIELMKFIRRDQQHLIIDGLSRQPYKVDILPPFNISFRANLGVLTETQHEEIRPLVVIEFFDKG